MIRPMLRTKPALLALALVAGLATAALQPKALASSDDKGLACSIEVVVQTRNGFGTVVGTETYKREFVLVEGGSYSDDFSTRTRFKFFDARFDKVNGEKTVSGDWFADVTVFNSVEVSTAVTLEDGDKRGKSSASHTLYTSGGSTTTTFTLSVVEN